MLSTHFLKRFYKTFPWNHERKACLILVYRDEYKSVPMQVHTITWKGGSRLDIEKLIDEHGDAILRLCLLYLGDMQLAEDAFQETFIKAWTHQSAFRGASSEKTWLSHIAVNTCRDMLRSNWLRLLKKSEPVDTLFGIAAPQTDLMHTDVRDAVLSLPGKYREVIVLYYHQEMTMKEMADLLGISINSVSTRLRRARALLKKQWGEEVDA